MTANGPRNPWWIPPPLFGRVPDIEPRLLTLLGLVSLAVFFEQYDASMLTAALKHIAADLAIGEADLGRFLGLIRLGALPALLLVPFADRIGRRRIFLLSVVGFSVGTMASGFAQTAVQFVALQMVTRIFMTVGVAVSVVIVTEEYPALHRGWAIGILGALTAGGQGLGALLVAFIDDLPFGWRFLYTVGIAPLALLPNLRRNIQETGRFAERAARGETSSEAWYEPLRRLLVDYPGRTAILGLIGLMFSLGELPVFQFSGYFVQTRHGWSPSDYSLMFLLGGAVGVLGNPIAGRLGDRIGRRWVGAVAYALFPIFAGAFYQGPGWSLPISWALFIFCVSAGYVTVRALSSELFPTAYRSTAAGWLSFCITIGWTVGLWLVSGDPTDDQGLANQISAIACAVFLCAALVLLAPETAQRELEDISND